MKKDKAEEEEEEEDEVEEGTQKITSQHSTLYPSSLSCDPPQGCIQRRGGH